MYPEGKAAFYGSAPIELKTHSDPSFDDELNKKLNEVIPNYLAGYYYDSLFYKFDLIINWDTSHPFLPVSKDVEVHPFILEATETGAGLTITFIYAHHPIVATVDAIDKDRVFTPIEIMTRCVADDTAEPLLLDVVKKESPKPEPEEPKFTVRPEIVNQKKSLSKMWDRFDDEQNAQITRAYTKGFAAAQGLFKKPKDVGSLDVQPLSLDGVTRQSDVDKWYEVQK
jgi:hypothetical protein